MAFFLTNEEYDVYWLEYLRHHRKRGTRLSHCFGTAIGTLGALAAFAVFGLVAGGIIAIIGYSIAVASHFVIERNKPFAHKPVWGLYTDFRMIKRTITGEIASDLARISVAPAKAGAHHA
jgi:hypothetical protein